MLGTIVVYGDKQNLPTSEQINVAANGVKERDNSSVTFSVGERSSLREKFSIKNIPTLLCVNSPVDLSLFNIHNVYKLIGEFFSSLREQNLKGDPIYSLQA